MKSGSVRISFNQTCKKVPGACSKQNKKKKQKTIYLWTEVDEQPPQDRESDL